MSCDTRGTTDVDLICLGSKAPSRSTPLRPGGRRAQPRTADVGAPGEGRSRPETPSPSGAAIVATRKTYHAFISYSRASDGKLAPALHRALHVLARPWYRFRLIHVFRDQANLSANPALWGSIEVALADSDYFLLMASPEAAHSKWVQQEVRWWLANRPIGKLFIVLTDGEAEWSDAANDFDWSRTSALPEALRGRFAQEPLWVDLRWAKGREQLSLRHSQFRDAVLDIGAPLLGKPKDELDGEDVRRYRGARRLAEIGDRGARDPVGDLARRVVALPGRAQRRGRERDQGLEQ